MLAYFGWATINVVIFPAVLVAGGLLWIDFATARSARGVAAVLRPVALSER